MVLLTIHPWTWYCTSPVDFAVTPMQHPVLGYVHENGAVMETFYWDTYETPWPTWKWGGHGDILLGHLWSTLTLAVGIQKWDSHAEVLVCHPGFTPTNLSMQLSSKQRIILTVAPGFNHTSWCNCPVNQGQCYVAPGFNHTIQLSSKPRTMLCGPWV